MIKIGVYHGNQQSRLIVKNISYKHKFITVNCKRDTRFSLNELVQALEDQLVCSVCGDDIHVLLEMQPVETHPKKLLGYGTNGKNRYPIYGQKRGIYDLYIVTHCKNRTCYCHNIMAMDVTFKENSDANTNRNEDDVVK